MTELAAKDPGPTRYATSVDQELLERLAQSFSWHQRIARLEHRRARRQRWFALELKKLEQRKRLARSRLPGPGPARPRSGPQTPQGSAAQRAFSSPAAEGQGPSELRTTTTRRAAAWRPERVVLADAAGLSRGDRITQLADRLFGIPEMRPEA